MSSTKKHIIRYSIELIIVAFGVFLGIIVSNWLAQQKVDNKVKKTLSYIISEMESNSQALERASIYHSKIKDELDSAISTLDREAMSIPYVENTQFKYINLKS